MDNLPQVFSRLKAELASLRDKKDKPVFEVHSWEKLSPFYNIARMIDLMTFFIKIMLVAIVLVSIMNVMIMAVYERINEIGTSIEDSISQQEIATTEIADSTQQAAQSAADVGRTIKDVDKAAANTDSAADNVVGAASKLGHDAAALRSHISDFLVKIRAA